MRAKTHDQSSTSAITDASTQRITARSRLRDGRPVAGPWLPITVRPARAEIGFGIMRAVGARSVIDLALLLGDRLRHRLQLQSLVSGCAGTNLRIPLKHGRCCCQAAATPVTSAADGMSVLKREDGARDQEVRHARR
jgi:hypothetical protein